MANEPKKWERVRDLSKNIGDIRKWYKNELETSSNILSEETSSALIVGMIDEASFRIGNKESATVEDPSFGVSQLRQSHITSEKPDEIQFTYRSKKGARETEPTFQRKTIRDPLIVKNIKKMRDATSGNFNCGGDKKDANLFCYIDNKGKNRSLETGNVTKFLKKFTTATPHNFRHLKGSEILLNTVTRGGSYRQGISKVAQELGHMRVVNGEKVFDIGNTAETNYVFPELVEKYGQGHFGRNDVYSEMGNNRQDIIRELKTSGNAERWRNFLTQDRTPIVRVKDVYGDD